MCILIGLGEKMAERFLPLYLVALGGGAWAVGLLNSLDNLLSALYSFPGGRLSDRFGPKRALLIFNLTAIVGYLLVIFVPSIWAVFLGSFLFISWTALSLPATMGLISEVLPKEKRTMGVSLHSLIRRIPMALGPILGGFLITRYGTEHGVRYAFAGALVMALVAIVFQEGMIEDTVEKRTGGESDGSDQPLIGPELRNLLISDILVRFCEQIPYPFVVLWCVNNHGLTGTDFGVLTTIEMVTAMLVYIPVAWLADRSGKKPFVLITFGFFTLFPLALMHARSFRPLIAAFIIRGLKEFGEPTRKALIMDLAPEGRKAAAFGAYYLWRDIAVAVGALSGAWFWNIHPEVNFWAASLFGLAGTLWFALTGTDLPVGKAKTVAREGDAGCVSGESESPRVSGIWVMGGLLLVLHLGAWMYAESLIRNSWKSRVDLLLDSLGVSAQQTLQAGRYLEERVGMRLKSFAQEVMRRPDLRTSAALAELCRKNDLRAVAVYDHCGNLVAASDETGLARELPKEFGCHDLIEGEKTEHFFGFSDGIFCEADAFGYAARLPEGGLVRVLADVGFVLGFEREAGLVPLIERFRRHPDILALNLVDPKGRILVPASGGRLVPPQAEVVSRDLLLHGKSAARFDLIIDDHGVRALRRTTGLLIMGSMILGVLALGLWFRRASRLEEIRERNRRLEEMARHGESLSRVVASVAHEIRNPLNTLALGIDSLRSPTRVEPRSNQGSGEDDARREARLEMLARTVAEANHLVSELLQTTRPILASPQEFQPEAWLEEVRLAFETACPEVRLACSPSAGFGSAFRTDGRILRGMALNLLTNAAQAGAREIRISCELHNGRLVLEIADDGPGVPEAVRRNLFMPGNTTRPDGSGLGLYNAWRGAAALGGSLELLETRPGNTRFVIVVPCADPGGFR